MRSFAPLLLGSLALITIECSNGHAQLGGKCEALDGSSLGTHVGYALNTGYYAVASGDLNGDGMLDLVAGTTITQPTSSRTTYDGFDVFFGLRDGGLADPVHYSDSFGDVLAVGDLNGDGLSDVVAAGPAGLNVYFSDPTGSLAKASTYYTRSSTVDGIAIGDVNGDGFPDLVLAERGGTGEILLNLGKGKFGLGSTLPLLGAHDLFSPVIADLDGDGVPDIAMVPFSSPPSVDIFLGQKGGGFRAASISLSFPTDWGAESLTAFAAPGGVTNLAVAGRAMSGNGGGAAALILINDGGGNFSQGASMPTESGYEDVWITTGDVNGDCLPDLIMTGCAGCTSYVASIAVWYANEDGGFTGPVAFATGGTVPEEITLLGPVARPLAIGVGDPNTGGVFVLGDASEP